jgi:phospholipase C
MVRSAKIQHIIWVMQENRSFDNLFHGFPGADTVASGEDSKGDKIPLAPITLATGWDIDHSSTAFFRACNGTSPGRGCKMNGFNLEQSGADRAKYPNPQYGFVPHDESKLYFEMAHAYVLGDRMFASHIDASYISHQYMVAGQANHAVDFPSGAWGCTKPGNVIPTLTASRTMGGNIPVCQNYTTLGDELDTAGVSWRLYAATRTAYISWSGYRSIRHIRYGADWSTNVIPSSSRFLSDVKSGTLASMTWVTPTCANSDHASCRSAHGPDWVASVVNAVGESKFWDSTVIFVMWDEWGGWYDHVRPPYEDFDGLGLRVPLMVISPYAKAGYISHVQYEHGSLLRFAEDQFGLPQLAASDTRANSPAPDCLDFTQKPRAFVPFTTSLHAADFIRMEPSEAGQTPDAE